MCKKIAWHTDGKIQEVTNVEQFIPTVHTSLPLRHCCCWKTPARPRPSSLAWLCSSSSSSGRPSSFAVPLASSPSPAPAPTPGPSSGSPTPGSSSAAAAPERPLSAGAPVSTGLRGRAETTGGSLPPPCRPPAGADAGWWPGRCLKGQRSTQKQRSVR